MKSDEEIVVALLDHFRVPTRKYQQISELSRHFWEASSFERINGTVSGLLLGVVAKIELDPLDLLVKAMTTIDEPAQFFHAFYDAFVLHDAATGYHSRAILKAQLVQPIDKVMLDSKNWYDVRASFTRFTLRPDTARLLFIPSTPDFTHPDVQVLAAYDEYNIYDGCGKVVERLSTLGAKPITPELLAANSELICNHYRLRKLKALLSE